MKIKIFIFIFVISLLLSGCYIGSPSYEVFERNNNWNIGKPHLPKLNPNLKKIYSEDRYIYILEFPKGCVVGYLTNRDDNPEVVQEWFIISGKEYCKDTETFILLQ
jgi:thioredoxin-related protein